MNNIHAQPTTQRGATLLVALIFLLVMTIAGISAMRFATFEERMASNTEMSNAMFQQAQSEIQAQLLEFNSGVAQLAPLQFAKDEPADTRDPEENPMLKSLPTNPLPKIPLALAITNSVPNIVDAENTLRYVADLPCDGTSADINAIKCPNYEMQVTAQSGTAKSWQTQGISYESR